SGFNERGMQRSTAAVDGDGTEVELVYPPDDQAWATETSADLVAYGSALEELTGVPFPGQSTVLRQGPNFEFDEWGITAEDDEVLILPRDYDERGLAATLALAWMSDPESPFTDAVIREGLAYEFASEAIARSGGRASEPAEPAGGAALDPEGRQWVIRQVADEIGYDGLTELLALARADETAYEGTGDAEPSATIPGDWRRFVDLAERRLGSERVAPVFNEHVLDAAGVAMLEDRADALDEYEQLESAADGVVPVGIRDAMTNWEFEEAETMLAAAQGVVDERDRIIEADAERAGDDGLALGDEWAEAESTEDLEAVQATILDRESELERGQLIRLALIGLGVLALIALVVGALLFRRRKAAGSDDSATPPTGPPPSGPAPDQFGVPQAVAPVGPAPAGPPAAPVVVPPADLGAPPVGQPAPPAAVPPAPVPPAPVPPAPGFAIPAPPPVETPAPVEAPDPTPIGQDPSSWAPPTSATAAAPTGLPPEATVEVVAPDLAPPPGTPSTAPEAGEDTEPPAGPDPV
ncbi:MAG: hypothetical protein AAFO29_00740, partial [Actinomycetota bacterium]